ncbi:MAG: hypothetical protein H7Y27_06895 [Gemmatimonadaceae bacterium]|nr:hypothetical protein [Chitinophagaceae bacterium]
MKAKILFTLLFSIGIIGIASAQPGQRSRMREGVRSGEITRLEGAKVKHDSREFRRHHRIAKKDGVISKSERKYLKKERKHNSRKLFRKKHNRRSR